MDVPVARRVLGVDPTTEWDDVRLRYRALIRRAHPDVEGGSTERATELNLAFATLLRARREPPPATPVADREPAPPPPPRRALADDVVLLGDDTLLVEDPPDETFRRVLAGLDRVAEITYVDRSGPIAEAVVVLDDGTSHSLVVSFQGRGATTEVFATLEALETVGRSSPRQVLSTLARFIPPRS